MKITESIHIEAPRPRVFGVFCDLEAAPEYVKDITAIEILEGPARLGPGTKWRETRLMFGKNASEVMWVTAFDQDVAYVVDAESHGAHYRTSYRFTPQGGATRVDFTFEGKPVTLGGRVMGIVGGMFAGASKKAMHEDLEQLKAACERPA